LHATLPVTYVTGLMCKLCARSVPLGGLLQLL
jgi:hypothetical protein